MRSAVASLEPSSTTITSRSGYSDSSSVSSATRIVRSSLKAGTTTLTRPRKAGRRRSVRLFQIS